MSTRKPNRILAVEIRASRLGYAVFETPKKLVDFGALWIDSHPSARLGTARLFSLYKPSVLVLRGSNIRYAKRTRQRKAVVQIVQRQARKLSIPVRRFPEKLFFSYLKRHTCQNKYDMAVRLAASFPEIGWRLPPRPKFYEPEPRSLLYFDSIALANAYLENN